MLPFDDDRSAYAPHLRHLPNVVQWLCKHLCTSNPFYVLSAGLFLAGLWMSFGAQEEAVETWALMSGLSGYTLLLAVTGCLLVRFGNVWDDVRTVLLLVVLMFLATSVTFDELVVLSPNRALACCLLGLSFAMAVSEGVLRAARLQLPVLFRAPYYLILAIFFLYPVLLSPFVDQPRSETLMWGLFAFSTAAGLAFLTLLPAIRKGPDYVRFNGSPWTWPLYPWTLFLVLAVAVPARAFLLCWSMHTAGVAVGQLIFGPYFLVPFVLILGILLLELGIVSARRDVTIMALLAPLAVVPLTLHGHRGDAFYQEFLRIFTARLGGDPLWTTLVAGAGFYAYAALRRVEPATEGLTAFLLALAFVGPDTLQTRDLTSPQVAPLLLAAALQVGLGMWRRSSWRCAFGATALVAAASLTTASGSGSISGGLIVFHQVLVALLILGAAFDDRLGRALRAVGVSLAVLASAAALFGRVALPANVPAWAIEVYPLILAAVLAAYGMALGHRLSLRVGTGILACCMSTALWRGYHAMRPLVVGLDYLAMSLGLFVVALIVSLAKSGFMRRWIDARAIRETPVEAQYFEEV